MGNQGSAERERMMEEDGDGRQSKTKKKSFLNCQCGKGRDDKDEIDGENRGGTKGTRLTEEEWAKVKTGRLHVDRGQPDLVLEESEHSSFAFTRRLTQGPYKEADAGEAMSSREQGVKKEPKNPYRHSSRSEMQQAKMPERFKVGDRVKCACKKWSLAHPTRHSNTR